MPEGFACQVGVSLGAWGVNALTGLCHVIFGCLRELIMSLKLKNVKWNSFTDKIIVTSQL